MKRILTLSLSSLQRIKIKTILTVIGIAIGCATMVLLISLGSGMRALFYDQVFEAIGIEPGTIVINQDVEDGFLFEDLKITNEDLAEIKNIEGIKDVKPDYSSILGAEAGGEVVGLRALEQDYLDELASKSNILTEGKIELGDNRVVLDYDTASKLGVRAGDSDVELTFRDIRQPNKTIKHRYGVNGVIKGLKVGNVIVMNEKTSKELIQEFGDIGYLAANIIPDDESQTEAVKDVLIERGYSAISYGDIVSSFNEAFVVIQAVLGSIGGIALIVALFGIANTMIVSVLERVKEIGIYKALGMKDRTIAFIFVVESAFVGLLGGLLGLLTGWFLGKIGNSLVASIIEGAASLEGDLFVVRWWLVLGVIVFAVVVSALAGLAPAIRASRIDPVEALRNY